MIGWSGGETIWLVDSKLRLNWEKFISFPSYYHSLQVYSPDSCLCNKSSLYWKLSVWLVRSDLKAQATARRRGPATGKSHMWRFPPALLSFLSVPPSLSLVLRLPCFRSQHSCSWFLAPVSHPSASACVCARVCERVCQAAISALSSAIDSNQPAG